MATAPEIPIRAAGAVLWRDAGGGTEIAVIHRPRYDDWSLPKGKLDRGETVAAAAVREIREETGISAVLGRRLGTVHYDVPTKDGGTAPKQVDYFTARPAADHGFTPGAEVDELRWLPVDAAPELLTYHWDHDIVAEFRAQPTAARTLLLVRHAKAGNRSAWSGDDRLRPLTDSGKAQAAALRTLLPLFGPDRVHAVPLVRCEDTVRGVADDLGVPVHPEPQLSEPSYAANPEDSVERLAEIVRAGGTPVVCSQGGVIPDLVGRLALSAKLDLPEPTSSKGSLWVLTFDPSPNHTPYLLAADYTADPSA